MAGDRLTVEVKRFDPGRGDCFFSVFELERQGLVTVLDLLFRIKDRYDPTLSFEFGCRFKKCGLCGVEINGKPALPCASRIPEGEDRLEISPLRNLNLVKDLVVDRGSSLSVLRKLSAFPSDGEPLDLGRAPELFLQLLECRECMICVSQCPMAAPERPIPFLFVRLALLKLHPGDRMDRSYQARELGVHQCVGCTMCHCPFGVPIRMAIEVLVDG